MTCRTVANKIKGRTLEEIGRTFAIEFPDGDLYIIFKCMLAVTNDLAVLYALAQV